MCYTIDEIRNAVKAAVLEYNSAAAHNEKIKSVKLFGSYARGTASDESDVDLLVEFIDPVVSVVSFFTLARALEAMEAHLATDVDMVQDPLPHGSLLDICEKVPLYEAA